MKLAPYFTLGARQSSAALMHKSATGVARSQDRPRKTTASRLSVLDHQALGITLPQQHPPSFYPSGQLKLAGSFFIEFLGCGISHKLAQGFDKRLFLTYLDLSRPPAPLTQAHFGGFFLAFMSLSRPILSRPCP